MEIGKIRLGLFFKLLDRFENAGIDFLIIEVILAGRRHSTWILRRLFAWRFMELTVEHIQISKVRGTGNRVAGHIRINQKIIKSIVSHQGITWEIFANIESFPT